MSTDMQAANEHYARGVEYLQVFERNNSKDALAQAFVEFVQTLKYNPDHPEANYVMAVFWMGLRKGKKKISDSLSQEAEKHLRKTLNAIPNHAKSHYYLGVIYAARQDWRNAEHHLDLAKRYGADDADTRQLLAKVQRRKNAKWWEFWK